MSTEIDAMTAEINANVTIINGVPHWKRTRKPFYKKGEEISALAVRFNKRPVTKREILDYLQDGVIPEIRAVVDEDQFKEFLRQVKKETPPDQRVTKAAAAKEAEAKERAALIGRFGMMETALYDIATEVVEKDLPGRIRKIEADQELIKQMLQKLIDRTNS